MLCAYATGIAASLCVFKHVEPTAPLFLSNCWLLTCVPNRNACLQSNPGKQCLQAGMCRWSNLTQFRAVTLPSQQSSSSWPKVFVLFKQALWQTCLQQGPIPLPLFTSVRCVSTFNNAQEVPIRTEELTDVILYFFFKLFFIFFVIWCPVVTIMLSYGALPCWNL